MQVDNSAFESDSHGMGSIVNSQFAKDTFDVEFDGIFADIEESGDFFVPISNGHEAQNLQFPTGQRNAGAFSASSAAASGAIQRPPSWIRRMA